MALPITTYYDGNFNGIGFWEQSASPGRYANGGRRVQVAYVHYPGSNDNSRESGGILHREFEITVAASQTDLDALEASLDTTNGINYHGGSHTVSLDYVQNRTDTFEDYDDSGTIVLGFTQL